MGLGLGWNVPAGVREWPKKVVLGVALEEEVTSLSHEPPYIWKADYDGSPPLMYGHCSYGWNCGYTRNGTQENGDKSIVFGGARACLPAKSPEKCDTVEVILDC